MPPSKRKQQLKAARETKRRNNTLPITIPSLPLPPIPDYHYEETDTESMTDSTESEYDLESVQESDDDTDSQEHRQDSICTVLKYKDGAGSQLRGFYGAGSRATKYRRASEQHERMKVASQCYSIAAMFNNQKVQAKSSPIIQSKARQEAKEEIETLLRLKTITQKKFGPEGITLATRRRYEMVRSFYWTTGISPRISRKQAALNVANAVNRGNLQQRQILKWEKQWMVDRL